MTFELCSWSHSQQPPQATTSTLCLHVHIYRYVHIMYLIHASTLKSANGKRVWIICNESTGRPQLHLYKRAVLHKHNCVRSRTILYTHMYIHVYSIYVFLFHSVIIIFFVHLPFHGLWHIIIRFFRNATGTANEAVVYLFVCLC